jgi:hypothetical protein
LGNIEEFRYFTKKPSVNEGIIVYSDKKNCLNAVELMTDVKIKGNLCKLKMISEQEKRDLIEKDKKGMGNNQNCSFPVKLESSEKEDLPKNTSQKKEEDIISSPKVTSIVTRNSKNKALKESEKSSKVITKNRNSFARGKIDNDIEIIEIPDTDEINTTTRTTRNSMKKTSDDIEIIEIIQSKSNITTASRRTRRRSRSKMKDDFDSSPAANTRSSKRKMEENENGKDEKIPAANTRGSKRKIIEVIENSSSKGNIEIEPLTTKRRKVKTESSKKVSEKTSRNKKKTTEKDSNNNELVANDDELITKFFFIKRINMNQIVSIYSVLENYGQIISFEYIKNKKFEELWNLYIKLKGTEIQINDLIEVQKIDIDGEMIKCKEITEERYKEKIEVINKENNYRFSKDDEKNKKLAEKAYKSSNTNKSEIKNKKNEKKMEETGNGNVQKKKKNTYSKSKSSSKRKTISKSNYNTKIEKISNNNKEESSSEYDIDFNDNENKINNETVYDVILDPFSPKRDTTENYSEYSLFTLRDDFYDQTIL